MLSSRLIPAAKKGIIIMTPSEALRWQAQGRPNKTAFICGHDVRTYQKLNSTVERLARGLLNHGVRAGDRVVLNMANVPALVLAYHACFRIGAIAAPSTPDSRLLR
jgi:long-chain acyl-CoA synthetase